MDRVFCVEVAYNRDERGNPLATWVTVTEDVDPEAQVRYKVWFHEYVVRGQDVKGIVKNYIEFLRSFGVPKENITIEDKRRTNGEVS